MFVIIHYYYVINLNLNLKVLGKFFALKHFVPNTI